MADADVLDGSIFGAGQPCFGCSPDHPHGLRLRFIREGDEILTRHTPTELQQGPLGIMHGGLVSTLADELAAWAVIGTKGKFPFTGSFDARLLRPIRIGVEIVGRAKIIKDLRRLIDVEVALEQQGETMFTGTFRFVVLDEQGAAKMLGRPIPEEWKRFCR